MICVGLWALRQFCSVGAETGGCVVLVCESCSVPIHEIVVRRSAAIPFPTLDVFLAPNVLIPLVGRHVCMKQEKKSQKISIISKNRI